jgi:hypothetical protein
MKSEFRVSILLILLTILLINLSSSVANTQTVTEPPVPVYLIYQRESVPSAEDSLKMAYKDTISVQRQALADANKQIDTLRILLQKSAAENSTRFTWLFTLLALFGITIIILLILISRIRKELPQAKRVERH